MNIDKIIYYDKIRLKALSDEIYFEQDRRENAQTKKNISIHGLEETEVCAAAPLEEAFILSEEKRHAVQAFYKLLQ